MRNLLIVAATLVICSCTPNEVCLDRNFGDTVWKRDSGNTMYDNVKFLDNGSFVADRPSLGFYGATWGTFEFDEGCGGFTLSNLAVGPDTTYHWTVSKSTESTLWMKQDGTSNTMEFHK